MRLTWFRRNSKQQVVKASGLQKKWSPFYFDNKPGKYLLVPGLAASLIKFRSLLQQYSQEQFNATPSYLLLDEKGPDHNKCFELEVVIQDRHFSSAWGTNKKEAEQKAAFNALVELGVIEKTAENPAE